MDYHYQVSVHTIAFITIFLLGYGIGLVRNAIKNDMDLYDVLLLATVAIVPALFVFFPGTGARITQAIGVAYAFEIIFGFLFAFAFIFLHRLVHKLNRQNRAMITLTQEVGLLRERLERAERRHG
jgi:hypothetical protein